MADNPKEGRTSVLATLTASVMAEKKDAARTLTPVAGERSGNGSTHPNAALPNDTGVFLSNEALHVHAKQLRQFAADAIAIADGLDKLVGEDSESQAPVDLDAVRKAKEAEADAKFASSDDDLIPEGSPDFNADFKAKQVAAQAQVFDRNAKGEPDESPALLVPVDYGWLCPTHNKATIKTSSKSGREYVGCPDCNQFKR